MNPKVFTQDNDRQLIQLIRNQGTVLSFLIEVLFCSEDQFTQKLMIIEKINIKKLDNSFRTTLMKLCSFKLQNKLVAFGSWKLLQQVRVFRCLMALIQFINLDPPKGFDYLGLIMSKVQMNEVLIGYLELTLIEEMNIENKVLGEAKNAVKKFISEGFALLKSNDVSSNKYFERLTQKEKLVVQAKLFKIFSWVVTKEEVSELDAEHLFALVPQSQDEDLIVELLSAKYPKCQEIIKGVLESKIQKKQGQDHCEFVTESKIKPCLLSSRLIGQLLGLSSRGDHSLQFCKTDQQNKYLWINYDVLSFSESSFSNLLPHSEMVRDNECNYDKMAHLFHTLFQKIASIFKKIAQNWTFMLLDLKEGNICLKECGEDDIQKLKEICLLIWVNMFKIMKKLDNEDNWQQFGTYNKFHNTSQCRKQNIIKYFQTLLNHNEVPSLQILSLICHLLKYLSQVIEGNFNQIFKNKDFMVNLNDKISKRAEIMGNNQILPVQILWLFCQKIQTFKTIGIEVQTFPINRPWLFNLVYQQYLSIGDKNYSMIKGPNFFTLGYYSEECNLAIFDTVKNKFNQFIQFLIPRFNQDIISIDETFKIQCTHTELYMMDKLVPVFNDGKFDDIPEVKDKLRRLTHKRPNIFANTNEQQIKLCLNKLKINRAEEEAKIFEELKEMLKSQKIQKIPAKVLIEDIWTDQPILIELGIKLEYWKLLLMNNRSLLNPQLLKTNIDINIQLKKLECTLKENIVEYFSNLQESALEHLQAYFSKVSEQSSLFTKYFGNTIESIRDSIRQVICNSNRQICYDFFINQNRYFNELEKNQDHYYLARSFFTLHQRYLQNVASNCCCFGPLFYTEYKEKFIAVSKHLFMKVWKEESKYDWRDDIFSPKLEDQIIKNVIESKKQNKNVFEEYKKLILSNWRNSIEKFIKNVISIESCQYPVLLNGKQFKGTKHMIRIQKSILIDFLAKEGAEFKKQYIPFYYFVIKTILNRLDDFQENEDQQDQQINSLQSKQVLNLIPLKDSNSVFSSALVAFMKIVFQWRFIKEFKEKSKDLIMMLLNWIKDKKVLEQEKQTLICAIIKSLHKFITDPESKLNEIHSELEWFDVFCRKEKINTRQIVTGQLVITYLSFLTKIIPQKQASQKQQQEEEKQQKQEVLKDEQQKQQNDENQDIKLQESKEQELKNENKTQIQKIQQKQEIKNKDQQLQSAQLKLEDVLNVIESEEKQISKEQKQNDQLQKRLTQKIEGFSGEVNDLKDKKQKSEQNTEVIKENEDSNKVQEVQKTQQEKQQEEKLRKQQQKLKKQKEDEQTKKKEEQQALKQKKKQIVELSFPFLVRLIPTLSSDEEPPEIIQNSIKILSLIATMKQRTDFEDSDLFATLVLKIMNNNNSEIIKFSSYFLKGCNGSLSSLLCSSMEKNAEKISIELDIKGFFFDKYLKGKGGNQEIEVQLDFIVNQFYPKYKGRVAKFRDTVKLFCHQINKEIDGKETIFLKYLVKNRHQFSYSQTSDSEFQHFKPPMFCRTQIKTQITKIIDKVQESENKLRNLQLLMLNYPIIVQYILFHSVKLKKDKEQDEGCQTFLDFMIKKSFNSSESYAKNFVGFACMDMAALICGKEGVHYLSEYVCYRVINLLVQSQFTVNKLQVLFYLLRYKRFSSMCNLNIYKDKKSVRDLVQQFLSKSRTQFTYSDEVNIVCLLILTILYRCNSLDKLKNVEHKLQIKASQKYLLMNTCILPVRPPFSGISQDEKVQQKHIHEVNSSNLQEEYQNIGNNIKKVDYDFPIDQLKVDELSLKVIFKDYKDYFQKCAQVPELKQYQDIDELLYENVGDPIGIVSKKLIKFYRNNEEKSKYYCKNNQLIYELPQKGDSDEDNDNQQIKGNHQPSRFAAEDYAPGQDDNRENDQEDEEDDDNNREELIKCFSERKVSIPNEIQAQKQQGSGISDVELTEQMIQIVSKINHNFSKLNKGEMNLLQCKDKSQEQILQYLKSKELQSQFDVKESTSTFEQFQTYCLSNVMKLDRLQSGRRNKVKLIQDQMLQFHMQRTASEDSIDYIIDTLDQNYQQLSKFERRVSKEEDLVQKTVSKEKVKKNYFKLNQLNENIFGSISQEVIFDLLLSFYSESQVIKTQSLVPFLQNPKVQDKIINTLIYILRNPFGNQVFPHQMHFFNEASKKNEEENIKSIKIQILRFIDSVNTTAFYLDQQYLLRQIGYDGIKGIVLEKNQALAQLFNKDKHIPIYQIFLQSLNSTLDRKQIFRFIKGVKYLPDNALDTIIKLFTAINQDCQKRIKDQGRIGHNYNSFFNQLKMFKPKENLSNILKIEKIKEKVRQAFPIKQDMVFSPFILCFFVASEVYSSEELKKCHQIILKKEKHKTDDIFFVNEVLKLYSDEELQTAIGLKEYPQFYTDLFQMFVKHNSINKIKKEQLFRFTKFPEFLPLKIKTSILKKYVEQIKNKSSFSMNGQIMAKRQKGIFESAFQELRYKPNQFWPYDFEVKFVNADGKVQTGYGDGVSKQWYTLVTRGMVNLNYGLFVKTSNNYYYFNRESWINPRHLQFFEFIGKVFAMSIVKEEYFVCPSFSILIYKMILGEKIQMKDIINQFDEGQVLVNIQKMREYSDDSLFCQTFVYQDKKLIAKTNMKSEQKIISKQYILNQTQFMETEGGQQSPSKGLKVLKVGEEIELVPDGANIPVTKDNLEDFILLTKEKIYDTIVNQVSKQVSAFIEGFRKVISPRYLKNFTAEELRQIVEGSDKVSVKQIKEHAQIRIQTCNKQLEWLWVALQEVPAEDRIYFIQHWTGCGKIPAGGVKDMKLQIRQRNYQKKIIFSHTCFNRIYIPSCEKEQEIKEAVLMAVYQVKEGLSIQED